MRTRRVPEGSEDGAGDRTGFGGRRYETERLGSRSFEDAYDDYLGFLEPFLVEAQRLLAPSGSLYLHLDYREVHYAKVLADRIFGRVNFVNEIIWAYDYGARPKRRWPAKHDNILFYAKDAARNLFNAEDIERIPYMAPGLAGPEKAARGKLPTDTWWHTIVSPTGKEKLGYPTQKPLGVLERIVRASSPPDGLVCGLRRGQRHDGRGGAAPRPPLRPRRRLAGGLRGDAPPLRRLRGRRVRGRDRRLMQDRYAGDIGDFGKYGLLRALCGEDGTARRCASACSGTGFWRRKRTTTEGIPHTFIRGVVRASRNVTRSCLPSCEPSCAAGRDRSQKSRRAERCPTTRSTFPARLRSAR